MPEIEIDDPSQIKISHTTGRSSVTVSLKGGTIISWKVFSVELLYTSPLADFDANNENTPIRGGIPIVFPQFNTSISTDIPKHGFARMCTWTYQGTEVKQDEDVDEVIALFSLSSNEQTKKYYPHDFQLLLNIQLGMTYLQTSLIINNTGTESIKCHALFHNYFRTDSIDSTVVSGLKNLSYTDSLTKQALTDRSALLPIAMHTDRIYHRHVYDEAASRFRDLEQVTLGDGGNAEITLKAINAHNVVVWNPYGQVEFKDLPKDDWKKFVCVEIGTVDKKIEVKPQETSSMSQRIVLKILADSSKSIRAAHAKQAVSLVKQQQNEQQNEQ